MTFEEALRDGAIEFPFFFLFFLYYFCRLSRQTWKSTLEVQIYDLSLPVSVCDDGLPLPWIYLKCLRTHAEFFFNRFSC